MLTYRETDAQTPQKTIRARSMCASNKPPMGSVAQLVDDDRVA